MSATTNGVPGVTFACCAARCIAHAMLRRVIARSREAASSNVLGIRANTPNFCSLTEPAYRPATGTLPHASVRQCHMKQISTRWPGRFVTDLPRLCPRMESWQPPGERSCSNLPPQLYRRETSLLLLLKPAWRVAYPVGSRNYWNFRGLRGGD